MSAPGLLKGTFAFEEGRQVNSPGTGPQSQLLNGGGKMNLNEPSRKTPTRSTALQVSFLPQLLVPYHEYIFGVESAHQF